MRTIVNMPYARSTEALGGSAERCAGVDGFWPLSISRLRRSRLALVSVWILCSACGGGAQVGAESPTGGPGAGPGPAGSGALLTNSAGQQVAVQELPGAAAGRPQMNAAAASAHAAGLHAFQSGDLKGAEAQFSRAIAADSNAYASHYSLGVVKERTATASQALASYQSSLKIVGDYYPALAGFASLMARTDQSDSAESFLLSKKAKYPKSASVLAALAEIKSVQGDSSAAQQLAQEALKYVPDFRPAMVILAREHYRNRRLDLALYTLKAILDGYGPENPARDKSNASAMLLRGLIYKEQGFRKPAMDELKRALALRPDLVEARLNLSTFMLEAGNASEAVPLLEGALKYDNSNVLVHLNLGDGYRLLGKIADARRQLEWVSAKDQNVAQAHYNLGLLYMFSKVEGMDEKQSLTAAVEAFERFKGLSHRVGPGAGDDVDALIKKAKQKLSIIEALSADGGDDGFD